MTLLSIRMYTWASINPNYSENFRTKPLWISLSYLKRVANEWWLQIESFTSGAVGVKPCHPSPSPIPSPLEALGIGNPSMRFLTVTGVSNLCFSACMCHIASWRLRLDLEQTSARSFVMLSPQSWWWHLFRDGQLYPGGGRRGQDFLEAWWWFLWPSVMLSPLLTCSLSPSHLSVLSFLIFWKFQLLHMS